MIVKLLHIESVMVASIIGYGTGSLALTVVIAFLAHLIGVFIRRYDRRHSHESVCHPKNLRMLLTINAFVLLFLTVAYLVFKRLWY